MVIFAQKSGDFRLKSGHFRPKIGDFWLIKEHRPLFESVGWWGGGKRSLVLSRNLRGVSKNVFLWLERADLELSGTSSRSGLANLEKFENRGFCPLHRGT